MNKGLYHEKQYGCDWLLLINEKKTFYCIFIFCYNCCSIKKSQVGKPIKVSM